MLLAHTILGGKEHPMSEQTILVCDVCGRPAAETATIRVGGRNFVKDYCAAHLSELTAGGRAPRRGRRKGVTGAGTAAAAPRRRGRPPKSADGAKRSTTRKRSTAKKSTGRRRGRPPKAQTSS
jgi:hypothetical protein